MKRKQYRYDGFGIPLILQNVPMINVRGVEVPDINYNLLEIAVLEKLCWKKFPLTGNEVQFIRQCLGMTPNEFAEKLGFSRDVLKHEKKENRQAGIAPSIELEIRLSALELLKRLKTKKLCR